MRSLRVGFLVFAVSLTFGLTAYAAEAEKAVSGEAVKDDFARSAYLKNMHTVMMGQRENLRSVLDAFLAGDTEGVAMGAEEIYRASESIDVSQQAREKDVEEEVWLAMMRSASHAQQMRDAARAKDLESAYEQYYELTAQCMACHQVVRDSA